MFNKKVLDNFSEQVEIVKKQKKFDYLSDSIEFIIESGVYDFITYTNINQFLNKSLKEKLLVEYSNKNLIADKFKKNKRNKLF